MEEKLVRQFILVFSALLITALSGCLEWHQADTAPQHALNNESPTYSPSWNDPKWIADRERVINTPTKAGCQERWDVLWTWAKKGNLQARSALAGLGMWSALIPPTSNKKITPYVVILNVHSLGYHDDYPGTVWQKEELIHIIKASRNFSAKDALLACIDKEDSQRCTQIAVEANYVPSFNDFAKVVDGEISKGNKPSCHESY